MKHGTGDRIVGGRTFTDVTESEMRDRVEAEALTVVDLWVTVDVRPGRTDRWVNAVALRDK